MNDELQTLHELEQLLRAFLAGKEEAISTEAANRIEGCIASSLPEDDELQELADSLAQYRPEGGDYLYSYKAMRLQVELALRTVRWRIG
jgi:hypothetical protein